MRLVLLETLLQCRIDEVFESHCEKDSGHEGGGSQIDVGMVIHGAKLALSTVNVSCG